MVQNIDGTLRRWGNLLHTGDVSNGFRQQNDRPSSSSLVPQLDPAELVISAEAMERFMAMRDSRGNAENANELSTLRIMTDEEINARNARRNERYAGPNDQFEIDLRWSKAGGTIEFPKWSLERFVAESLEGRVEHTTPIANELARLIRGFYSNPNATVEERATNREHGLRLAQYIADNFFDNPDEAQKFMDGMNQFAENDVWREKGYIVTDNGTNSRFRRNISAASGEVSWDYLARRLGIDFHEARKNGTIHEANARLLMYIQERSRINLVRQEVLSEMTEFSRITQERIDNATSSFDDSIMQASIERLKRAFYESAPASD